jgi:HAD superfamily hydrolase (TIGR01509 family)
VSEPSEPTLAIFDHDGVLVDSLALHQEAWLELGRITGLPFTETFIRETFGMTNPSIFRRLLGDEIEHSDIARLGALKEACYRELAAPRLELISGVRSLLDELSDNGVALAIGSSGPRANLELTVERCGLSGRFQSIAALEDITHGKPNPEVFLIAAKRAGVAPHRCLVFEDAVVGIQAAKSAGMTAIGVGGTTSLESLSQSGADGVVTTLEGFPIADWLKHVRAQAAAPPPSAI